MSKAVAIEAVFLVGVIAILLLFLVGMLSGWTGVTKRSTGQAGCILKSTDYCRDLVKDRNPQWEEIPDCPAPSESECCTRFNIC